MRLQSHGLWISGKVALIIIENHASPTASRISERLHLFHFKELELQTFESFVEGAGGDAQMKNAVLLEATRCIFATANTGYLGAEDDNPSSRIIEIMKTVSGSAGK